MATTTPRKLSQAGLIGWDKNEPVIAAAIAADCSIMFAGAPGTGKTVGAGAIKRALFGDEGLYAAIPCPEVSRDSLTGPVDIPAMQKGQLDYLNSDQALWNKRVVLLDEPNRAPQYVQHLLLEFVRTRRLAGRDTAAELVISAMNPPDLDPTTVYLSAPLAQRYVYCWAPGPEHFLQADSAGGPPDDFCGALFSDIDAAERDTSSFDGCWASLLEARKLVVASAPYERGLMQRSVVEQAIFKVAVAVQQLGVPYSMRQARHLRRMMEGLFAAYMVDGDLDYFANPQNLGRIAHATVGEFFGAVASRTGNVSGGAVLPQQFIDEAGEELIRCFATARTIHMNVPKAIGRHKKASEPSFNPIDYGAEVLDLLAAATDEDISGKKMGNAISAMHANTDLPEKIRDTLIRRFRLRKLSISRPNAPFSVRHLDTTVRRGKKMKKQAPVRNRKVFTREVCIASYERCWNHSNVQANSGILLPNPKRSTPLSVITRGRDLNAYKHEDRVLYLLADSTGTRVGAVLVDPFHKDDEERVLFGAWMVDDKGRVKTNGLANITWEAYTATGLRTGHTLYTQWVGADYQIVGCIYNPTLDDGERLNLNSFFSHGVDASHEITP